MAYIRMDCYFRPDWWLRLTVCFVLLAAGLVHADITQAQSLEYRLGPGDKINVAVFGRADLSGIFTIRDSGSLSLPIAGEIGASKLTLTQLEAEIGKRYSVLMESESGPDQAISVNIEIVEHRPFYIMGDVSRPGSYEYQKRLTVLRAIAIAGGYASSGPDARVAETRARESMDILRSNYIAAIAREARLVAELKGRGKIAFPQGLLKLKSDPFVAEILGIERQLFIIRRDLFKQELEIIQKRKQQFGLEYETLVTQSEIVARKRKEVDELLGGARDLFSDGLLPRFDLSSFVIMQADIERESREIVVAQSRAQQGISEMEQQALILRSERARAVTSELERIRVTIDETLVHLRAEANRLAIMQVKTVGLPDSAGAAEMPKIRITRETAEGIVSFDATNNTVIFPGDVISIPYQEGEAFLSLPGRVKN